MAKQPLIGHGFYYRTLVDAGFDGVIRVRRFLFSKLRVHLLGWPARHAPQGRRATMPAACPAS